ncbi:TY-Chap domain-containing protein [Nocardia sp. CA-151230]|uniref:TY-Chap domain-containing protein n=1 Tax=Nocardia sp. CA-151230 TaxID=3239982 RepID=UPI003D8E35F0
MTGWDDITDRLARQLSVLPDGAVVNIVGLRPGGVPVQAQVAQFSDSLWATFQGRSSAYPEIAFGIDPELMTAAGWQPPENSDHGTSWWIELPWPVPMMIHRQLAHMIVTGFRDFHRMPDTAGLTYDAWDYEPGSGPLELPLLGIPAQERP